MGSAVQLDLIGGFGGAFGSFSLGWLPALVCSKGLSFLRIRSARPQRSCCGLLVAERYFRNGSIAT